MFDKKILIEIVTEDMPFGKYKGTILADLPVSYLEWFLRKGGFPPGRLGQQLATVFEIKSNGLQDHELVSTTGQTKTYLKKQKKKCQKNSKMLISLNFGKVILN